eukprot:831622-Rhodomonas_salina.1
MRMIDLLLAPCSFSPSCTVIGWLEQEDVEQEDGAKEVVCSDSKSEAHEDNTVIGWLSFLVLCNLFAPTLSFCESHSQ